MPTWTQHDVHKHMHVFSADNQNVGHIEEVYEDSFLIRKGFFAKDRYIPYSAITNIDQDGVHLSFNTDTIQEKEWEKRPDYEDHLGDPTQLLYDRGHGVHDPFDEENPDKP